MIFLIVCVLYPSFLSIVLINTMTSWRERFFLIHMTVSRSIVEEAPAGVEAEAETVEDAKDFLSMACQSFFFF